MSTRPRALRGATAAVLLLVATACTDDEESSGESGAESEQTAWEFTSRPDLNPPRIDITTTKAGEAARVAAGDDYIFLAPKDKEEHGAPMNGPVIYDADGDPVWVHPLGDTRWSYDLRVQQYRGEPVLTWWRGNTFPFGYGEGEFVIMNQSYEQIATVTTPGTHADFHDLTLTSEGTALLTSYPRVQHDLTSVEGPSDGYLRDCVVQEVDVETGKVLFEWSALDHIPMTESQKTVESGDEEESGTKEAPFDPYHFNSVTEDGENALLVSARNTHTVYRIDQKTGKIDWKLGGEDSDFEMVGDSEFAWQHDAERQPDGTITLFDNQAAPQIGDHSRGLRLELDEKAGTAEIVTEYLPPDGERLSDSQGNLEVRENGNVFIGWGSEEYYSAYSADGELLMDAELSGGISYRAYRLPWAGRPTEPPKFVLDDKTAYVSWNGATEVDKWRFVAGYDEQSAKEVETVPADGFETSAKMPDAAYVAAQALDASGKVLATAEPGSWP